MPEYTDERVEEMIREAVEKTERSFGGTFKRLKSENEALREEYAATLETGNEASAALERRIAELEALLDERTQKVSVLAVQSELERQLREKGPVPERFIDRGSIVYTDDPEALAQSVGEAVERGKQEFERTLAEMGIESPAGQNPANPVNPTNPAARDTSALRDMKRLGARDALSDMTRRGLLR